MLKTILEKLASKAVIQWIGGVVVAVLIWIVGWLSGRVQDLEIPPLPPLVDDRGMGWVDDSESVDQAMAKIQLAQGFEPRFVVAAQDAIAGDTDDPVFMWDGERKLLGRLLPSWNQGSAGTCVGNGWARGAQDLVIWQCIRTEGREEWPGAEVAVEPVYGGSRVEVGGSGGRSRIRGDGSVGAWAGEWYLTRGVLFRKVYPGGYDLTAYSIPLCRQWGSSGVPDALETIAKEHPIRGVARVESAQDIWNAIGNYYPVPICSNLGFDSPLKEGFCPQRGTWAHCMLVRGRFTHASKGRCFVIQNSWGNYLPVRNQRDKQIDVKGKGLIDLPEGCFCITEKEMDRIAKQKDSFAISDFKGFPAQKLDTFIHHRQQQRKGNQAWFALAF